jgi:hypothetical protein
MESEPLDALIRRVLPELTGSIERMTAAGLRLRELQHEKRTRGRSVAGVDRWLVVRLNKEGEDGWQLDRFVREGNSSVFFAVIRRDGDYVFQETRPD